MNLIEEKNDVAQALLGLSSLGVYLVDSDNRVAYANDAFCQLIGYESGAILNELVTSVEISNRYKKGAKENSEQLYRKKGGGVFFAKTEMKQIRIDGQSYSLIILMDVSEYKEAHLKLSQQKELLQESLNLTDSLYKLERGFISGDIADKQDVYESFLYTILAYTGSTFGFIGEILNHEPCKQLKLYAVSDAGKYDGVKQFFQEDDTTLLNNILNSPKSLIQHDTDKSASSLKSYIAVPIIKGNEHIGVIVVANAPEGYSEITLKRMMPFVSSLMLMIDYNKLDSQRKEQEIVLKESEQRLKTICDSLNIPIVISDPDTCELKFVNESMVKTIGYTEKELLKMSVVDFDVQHDFEYVKAAFGKVIQNKKHEGNTRWLTKKGELRDLLLNASAVEIKGKSYVLSACYDVTEHKMTLKELNEKQLIADSVIDSMNEGVIIWNKKGVILEKNKFAEQVFGFIDTNINKLLDFNLKKIKFFDEQGNPKKLEELAIYQTFSHGLFIDGEIIKIDTLEGIRWYKNSSWCIPNIKPQDNIYVAKFTDITDQKNAELALNQSEDRFKELFENVPVGIFTTDVQGQIMSCNSLCAEMFGYSLNQMMELNVKHLIANKFSRNKHDELMQGYFHNPMAKKMLANSRVVYGLTKNGNKIPLEVSLSYYKIDNVPQAIAIVSDFSEKEEAFNTKKMLDERETLLKEIHHRVKNNMQIISSLLSLQSSKIQDKDSLARFRESESRIKSMALIHEKLYESDSLSEINLAEYISELADYLVGSYTLGTPIKVSKTLEAAKLNIEQCIPCGLIMNEFLTNALKYAFEGKKSGEIHIILKEANGLITIGVHDDGTGLHEAFDKKNTLGLRLIKSLTKQLKGSLSMVNDGGARCQVTFAKQKPNESEWGA